jgi:predicted TIM-barrel fold metal-dependent hydrolase
MFSAGPLAGERMMFSADYPFESSEEAGRFMDTVPLDDAIRSNIAFNNAARLLKL